MLGYLSELSKEDRATLLTTTTLCDYDPIDCRLVGNATAFPPQSVDYTSQLDTDCDETVKTCTLHATIVGRKVISVRCALNTRQQSSPARSVLQILVISKMHARILPVIYCMGNLAFINSLPMTSRILKQMRSCLLSQPHSRHFLHMTRRTVTMAMMSKQEHH